MDFGLLHLQFDALHAPRLPNPQNLGVQISILHSPIIGSATIMPEAPPFLWFDKSILMNRPPRSLKSSTKMGTPSPSGRKLFMLS